MTLVKICGLRDAALAVETAKAGADFVGLMFAAESRRRVTPQECHDIVAALHEHGHRNVPATFEGPRPGEVRGSSWFGAWADAIEDATFRARPLIVGVFAGMEVDEVNDIAETAKLDLVQLSGGESWDFAARVARPTIRTIHVGNETAEELLDSVEAGRAAAVMLDKKSDAAQGGTGQVFDWATAAEFGFTYPFVLAGGLSPENVAEAIEVTHSWVVDVSTGVETDGTKDIEKIRAFIRAAKGAHVGN